MVDKSIGQVCGALMTVEMLMKAKLNDCVNNSDTIRQCPLGSGNLITSTLINV